MKTENIIFLFWAVIFILILCQLFYFGPKKRRYLNTYTEVLDVMSSHMNVKTPV